MQPLFLLSICVLSEVTGHPIKKRMVDLTYTFDEKTIKNPLFTPFQMTLTTKGNSSGFWLQAEDITTGTHVGTHMDAPSHAVEGGMNIDDIPVTSLIAPASVIDVTQRALSNPDTQIVVDDFLNFERTTGRSLDGTIVLFRSGWGQKWGDQDAFLGFEGGDITKPHFPGLEPTAAEWLVENRDIKGVGIDTLSIDSGASMSFLSHGKLLRKEIFALENLANLDEIPLYGATLYVMPMKIGGAGGSPTRVIAIFPERNQFHQPWWSFEFPDMSQFFSFWSSWSY